MIDAITPVTERRLADLRELWQAELRRVEAVLTTKLEILDRKVQRLDARLKTLEEHRP